MRIRGDRLSREEWLLRLCFVAVIAVYAQSVLFDFVYDDHLALSNPWLTSWSGLKPIFTQHSWAWNNVGTFPARHYRPMFLLWLSGIVRVAGFAPGWFHLCSMFAHMVAVYLAFLLAKRLLGDGRLAAISTLVFALHPTKVEGVAWISSFEPLLAVFFFSAVLSYIRAREESVHQLLWMLATFILMMAAALTKETAVVLPGVMVACEVLACARSGEGFSLKKCLWLAAPGVAAIALFLLIRMRVLGGLGDEAAKMPLTTNLFTAPLAFWLYVRQLVWPVHLSALYPVTVVSQFSAVRVALPAVALLIVVALYWRWARRSSVLKFAAVWYLLTLLPVIGQFNWVQLHDRHLYLPTFAVGLMVAVAISQIHWPEKIDSDRAQAAVAVTLALVMAVLSARELRVWETDRTLFSRAVEVAPLNAEAVDLLAESYDIVGDRERAVATWQDGLGRMPASARLNLGIGSHFYAQGDYSQALPYLERLGNSRNPVALYELGLTEAKLGMRDRAIGRLSRASELAPNNAGYRRTLESMKGR